MTIQRFLSPHRLILWLLPWVTAVSLLAVFAWIETRALIAEAERLLIAGEGSAAEQRLAGLARLPGLRAEARAGLELALALGGAGTVADGKAADRADLDGDGGFRAFDLALITRAAFDRGDFGAVLRLDALATSRGLPPQPWITLAARIEQGAPPETAKKTEARAALMAPPARSVLARRVRAHLDSPQQGIVLRSRDGRRLGVLSDGAVQAAPGLDARWLPNQLTELEELLPHAGSIRTSLDLELMEAAAGAFGRFRGSIVLVDPWTGEILAAVSDRKTRRRDRGTPALEQFREPASISKLITTAAYLRQGLDPEARLAGMACRGHESYAGERLYCPVIAGRLLGLDRAMAVSCNVAFAELAEDMGRGPLLEELRRFGFDRPLGPFAGGRIVTPYGDERQLADMAIGLEATELTPLHAALVAATVATGGDLVEPTLLRGVDGRLGLHPRTLRDPSVTRVLEPEHAETLRRSMVAVAQRGTGQRMRTHGFPVAMKTGTASHPQYGFHVNYVGFGPLPEARVAFCVRITHQATSRRVRAAATEVTRRLFRRLRTVSRQRGWQTPSRSRLTESAQAPQRLAERRDARAPGVVGESARAGR